MKLACLFFTAEGEAIANTIKELQDYEVTLFSKEIYKEHLEKIFGDYEGVIFISSTGIAVRICSKFIKDKSIDPAVIVIDDLCRYCISLLSGHLGGANILAQKLANELNALPIVTTATDGRGIEAVDVYAKRNGFAIENLSDVKKITAMMLEGKSIRIFGDIAPAIEYKNLVSDNEEAGIIITSSEKVAYHKKHCILRPGNLNIGIGCRRGKTVEEILSAIDIVFKENNLSLKSIKDIATVDVKKDEEGIIEAAERLKCGLRIFDREDIKKVENEFSKSDFVRDTIGVTSVCEPCAYLAGGKIIVKKTVINGITLAVSKEEHNG